jgi:fumarylpyruvate hydrolase
MLEWSQRPELPIDGGPGAFPIARIFGIGRNYSERPAEEVKCEEEVVLFTKDPYLVSNICEPLQYPEGTTRLRHEVELVVALGRSGAITSVEDAHEFVFGYGVGIDFTKYDVQDAAKAAGRPWESGKSFPGCAPCSPIVPAARFSPKSQRIWLKQDDRLAQSGSLDQMIWAIPELILLISKRFTLKAGDLIFTGTPTGVGMVQRGECLSGGIDGMTSFSFNVR